MSKGEILPYYDRNYTIDMMYDHSESFAIMDHFSKRTGLCYSQKSLEAKSFLIAQFKRKFPREKLRINKVVDALQIDEEGSCNIMCENDPKSLYEFHKNKTRMSDQEKKYLENFDIEKMPQCQIDHYEKNSENIDDKKFVAMLKHGNKIYFHHRNDSEYIHLQKDRNINNFCKNFPELLKKHSPEIQNTKRDIVKTTYNKAYEESRDNSFDVNLEGKCIRVCQEVDLPRGGRGCNTKRVGHEYKKLTEFFGGFSAPVCAKTNRENKINKFIKAIKKKEFTKWRPGFFEPEKTFVSKDPVLSIKLIKESKDGNLNNIFVAINKDHSCVIKVINRHILRGNGKVRFKLDKDAFKFNSCESDGKKYLTQLKELKGKLSDNQERSSEGGDRIEIKYRAVAY